MDSSLTTTPRPAQYGTSHWLRIVAPADRAPVLVKLFHDSEDRESPEYGPYVFVQTSYNVLRGITVQHPREEEAIAELDPDTGLWRAQDGQYYTDVALWPAKPRRRQQRKA